MTLDVGTDFRRMEDERALQAEEWLAHPDLTVVIEGVMHSLTEKSSIFPLPR